MKRLSFLLAAMLAGCAYPYTPHALPPASAPDPAAAEVRQPVTILVSIDGFRADYLARRLTPRLSGLAAGGVSAAMRPAFPSKTFPNHWTLVTGLTPDHHGIVANKMVDPEGKRPDFSMTSNDPYWWNAATPVWVDAEQADIRTATMLWPGSNVAVGGTKGADGWASDVVGGVRPQDWAAFDQAIDGPQRVREVLDWLRRPAAYRPRFLTLYFDTVDTAGHRYGPDAQQTDAAIADIDATIGRLVDGLASLGQPANLVIVADHGMAAIAPERTIALDQFTSPADYRLYETGPYATFYPVAGHEAALERALFAPHDHLHCWRKADIPARLHYGTNQRIPPYFCLADIGWSIERTAPHPRPGELIDHGEHGADNAAPEMAALFIANGPAIRPAGRLPAFDNVDIAPLVRDLIGLPAKQGDGDDAPFRAVLAR